MIESAISNTVHIRRVTTTAIVAKLAVCAILVADVASAHAAADVAATHAIHKAAAKKPVPRLSSQAKLARLERDWKRLHNRRQHGALDRLVACREYGRCEGLKVHPTLGAALIRVSPERPSMGAAISPADRPRTMATDVHAGGKAVARLRSKPDASARIRAAAADDGDQGGVSTLYSGAASVNP